MRARPGQRGGARRDRRDQDHGAGGGAQGRRQQPQVPRGKQRRQKFFILG